MGVIMFGLSASVMAFIGWLYVAEIRDVNATKAAVTVAVESTAMKLSQSVEPERNTDADADGIFKASFQQSSALDDVAVRQSLQPLSPGRFRQSVAVSGRARTGMSEFFGMHGAEIEIVATHDFDRKK